MMTERRFRHMPVIEDGALVGIVSIGDLVKARIDRWKPSASSSRATSRATKSRLRHLHQAVVGVLDDRALGGEQR